VLFVCVWNISGTAERICANFTRKTSLALARTRLNVKVKGQGHQVQETGFWRTSRQLLNWFTTNSNRRRVWSNAWMKLKVKVKDQRSRSPRTKNGVLAYRELLNGFATNSHKRRVWTLARMSLKVKVKGESSGSPGTKAAFSALSAACVRFMFSETCLTCSFISLYAFDHCVVSKSILICIQCVV